MRKIDRFESADGILLTKMQLHVGRISGPDESADLCHHQPRDIVILLYVGSGRRSTPAAWPRGDVIALVNYMNQILVELVKLANLIVQVSKALACASRVQAVLDTEPGMEFPTQLQSAVDADKADDAVRFDHVSLDLRTGPVHPASSDISIHRQAAARPSASSAAPAAARSSLVSLIPRFYDATEGTVEILGRPVKDYPRETSARQSETSSCRRPSSSAAPSARTCSGAARTPPTPTCGPALETAQAAEFVQSEAPWP